MADTTEYLTEEPPTGSVIAINWRDAHQEVWVSNSANVGSWYTPGVPLGLSNGHSTWRDVLRRAEGGTLTLLVAANEDTYRAGYRAGAAAVARAVVEAADDANAL